MASKATVRAKPKIDGLGGALTTSFEAAPVTEPDAGSLNGEPLFVNLEHLEEDPANARRMFDEDALRELADTVREHGVIEPLVVVRLASDRYQIRSGARRYRAAGMAGQTQVPVWVKKDLSALAAVVVNLQRENLHPVELGDSLAEIASKEGVSSQQMAAALGRSKTWVSRYLSMSRLTAEDKSLLRELETGDATLLADVSKLLKTHRQSVQSLIETGSLDRTSVAALLSSVDKPGSKISSKTSKAKPAATAAKEGAGKTLLSLVVEHENAEWILDLAQEPSSKGSYKVRSNSDASVKTEIAMPIRVVKIQSE